MYFPCAITDSDVNASPELSQEARRYPDTAKPTAENRRRGVTPVDNVIGEAGTGGTPSGTVGAIPAAGAVAGDYPMTDIRAFLDKLQTLGVEFTIHPPGQHIHDPVTLTTSQLLSLEHELFWPQFFNVPLDTWNAYLSFSESDDLTCTGRTKSGHQCRAQAITEAYELSASNFVPGRSDRCRHHQGT